MPMIRCGTQCVARVKGDTLAPDIQRSAKGRHNIGQGLADGVAAKPDCEQDGHAPSVGRQDADPLVYYNGPE
jgi:hypothetical protein